MSRSLMRVIAAGLRILTGASAGPVGGYPNLDYNPTGLLLNQEIPTNRCRRNFPLAVVDSKQYAGSSMGDFHDG